MKLRLLIFSSAFLLTGCSLVTPTPDATLVRMGESAMNDAAGAGDPTFQELRKAQARLLFDEVARLCGHNSDGEVPEGCVFPTADAQPTARTAEEAAADVLSRVGEVPTESLPQIAVMYAQLAMLSEPATVSKAPTLATPEVESLRNWEQGAIFALDVASAFAGAASADVADAVAAHEEVLAALPASTTATPTSFDISQFPQVSDAGTARELIIAVEAESVKRWNFLATASATPPEWRTYALTQAGNAAARYAKLVSAAGQDPFAADFLELEQQP